MRIHQYIVLLFVMSFYSSWAQELTCNLCSFLLTITAVICWSKKTKIVERAAGTLAAKYNHQGFLSLKGLTSHPRPGLVGYKNICKITFTICIHKFTLRAWFASIYHSILHFYFTFWFWIFLNVSHLLS